MLDDARVGFSFPLLLTAPPPTHPTHVQTPPPKRIIPPSPHSTSTPHPSAKIFPSKISPFLSEQSIELNIYASNNTVSTLTRQSGPLFIIEMNAFTEAHKAITIFLRILCKSIKEFWFSLWWHVFWEMEYKICIRNYYKIRRLVIKNRLLNIYKMCVRWLSTLTVGYLGLFKALIVIWLRWPPWFVWTNLSMEYFLVVLQKLDYQWCHTGTLFTEGRVEALSWNQDGE